MHISKALSSRPWLFWSSLTRRQHRASHFYVFMCFALLVSGIIAIVMLLRLQLLRDSRTRPPRGHLQCRLLLPKGQLRCRSTNLQVPCRQQVSAWIRQADTL